MIDPVTNLIDQVGAEVALRACSAESKQQGFIFTVLMVEIDEWVVVRHHLGEQRSNEALREVASILLTCVRETDTVARWSDTEFFVLLPQTEMEGAFVVAERMRLSVERAALASDARLDIGLASGPTVRDIVKMAGVGLYEAKSNGGNQAKAFSPPATDFQA